MADIGMAHVRNGPPEAIGQRLREVIRRAEALVAQEISTAAYNCYGLYSYGVCSYGPGSYGPCGYPKRSAI